MGNIFSPARGFINNLITQTILKQIFFQDKLLFETKFYLRKDGRL